MIRPTYRKCCGLLAANPDCAIATGLTRYTMPPSSSAQHVVKVSQIATVITYFSPRRSLGAGCVCVDRSALPPGTHRCGVTLVSTPTVSLSSSGFPTSNARRSRRSRVWNNCAPLWHGERIVRVAFAAGVAGSVDTPADPRAMRRAYAAD